MPHPILKLNEEFFRRIFAQFKKDLTTQGKELSVLDFPSSGAGSTMLANMLVKSETLKLI